jgi:hypothetical protein
MQALSLARVRRSGATIAQTASRGTTGRLTCNQSLPIACTLNIESHEGNGQYQAFAPPIYSWVRPEAGRSAGQRTAQKEKARREAGPFQDAVQ